MPDQALTPKQSLLELNDLRARLGEAEETLRAIRSGEVDALMVGGAGGEQLFTLKGADVYRTLIEEMSEGALTMTAEGLILYANRRFAEMIKTPLEKVIGATIHTWIAPDSQAILQSLLRKDADEKRREQLVLSASDGTRVPVYLSVSKLRNNVLPDAFCLVATDLTEQKRTEAIVAAATLARELLAAANQSRRALLSVIEDQQQTELTLARTNRALRTLSAVNVLLVRAVSEGELLQPATRIIVEQGGYRMVRVILADDNPEMSLSAAAWAGAGEDFFAGERPTWDDTQEGQVPIARAIRSGTPQVCRDIVADPGYAVWRESALARGYASNIGLPLSDSRRTFGGLSIYSTEKDVFDDEEVRLLTELANDLAYGITTLRTRVEHDRIAHEQLHHTEMLRQSLEDSIKAIANTVEMRDPYTAGHQRRVGQLAVAIARELGLPEETIRGIELAASIHDLGKISVPAEILSKPGKLTAIELMLLKTHAQAGFDILKAIKFPWPIASMVLQHHERLDGSGYPQGLKGEQILLESRIMAVADVVEAMASHRPYRAALGIDAALQEIEQGRGTAFDTAVVDACIRLFAEKRFAFSS
ncbi:MAG TPA: HD domain-containing phosphohydrolase [Rhodoferax sp.]